MFDSLFSEILYFFFAFLFVLLSFYLIGDFALRFGKYIAVKTGKSLKFHKNNIDITTTKQNSSKLTILKIFLGLGIIITILQTLNYFFPAKQTSIIIAIPVFTLMLWKVCMSKGRLGIKNFKNLKNFFLVVSFVLIIALAQLIYSKHMGINAITNHDSTYYYTLTDYLKQNPSSELAKINSQIPENLDDVIHQEIVISKIRIGSSILDSTFATLTNLPGYKYHFISRYIALTLLALSLLFFISNFRIKKLFELFAVIGSIMLSPILLRTLFDDFLAFIYGLSIMLIILALMINVMRKKNQFTKLYGIFIGILASSLISIYSDLLPLTVLTLFLFLAMNLFNIKRKFKAFVIFTIITLVISISINPDATIRAINFLNFQAGTGKNSLNSSISFFIYLATNFINPFAIGESILVLKILRIIALVFLTLIGVNIIQILWAQRKKAKTQMILALIVAQSFFIIYFLLIIKFEYAVERMLTITSISLNLLLAIYVLPKIELRGYFKTKEKNGKVLLILFLILFIFGAQAINSVIIFRQIDRSSIRTIKIDETFFREIKQIENINTIRIVGNEFGGIPLNAEHIAINLNNVISQKCLSIYLNSLSYYLGPRANAMTFYSPNSTHIIDFGDLDIFKNQKRLVYSQNYILYEIINPVLIPTGYGWIITNLDAQKTELNGKNLALLEINYDEKDQIKVNLEIQGYTNEEIKVVYKNQQITQAVMNVESPTTLEFTLQRDDNPDLLYLVSSEKCQNQSGECFKLNNINIE